MKSSGRKTIKKKYLQQKFSILCDTTGMISDIIDTCKDSILKSGRKGIFGNNSVFATINFSRERAGVSKIISYLMFVLELEQNNI